MRDGPRRTAMSGLDTLRETGARAALRCGEVTKAARKGVSGRYGRHLKLLR